MRWPNGIAWILAVAVAGSATGQSLGEAAAKEKKRREALKAAGKDDKTKARTFSDTDVPKSDEGAEQAGQASDDSPAPLTSDEGKRARAVEIKKSLGECHAGLAAARAAVKAEEAAPVAVPRPSDDPFNEEPPAEDPPLAVPPPPPPTKEQKVLAAKALVAKTEQQCEDIEESARKQGIPAGWIR